MSQFTWMPSKGFTTDTTPRVRVAKFGDGYAQRIADGINTLEQTWNLTFGSIPLATADAIEAFFVTKAGVVSFTWTPPDSQTEYWVLCSKWSITYETDFSRVVSATFERVYD